MKKIILLLLTYFLLIGNAFAYLDPGSGSIILQAIIGFIAMAGATVSLYWQKVKSFFKKIFQKKK